MLFGSTTLEVAIGMVFVYLLLSLLCSAINEYIEATLNYRGKNLRKGIEMLLNDQGLGEQHVGWLSKLLQRVKVTSPIPKPPPNSQHEDDAHEVLSPPASSPTSPPASAPQDLAYKLYSHGLVRALYRDQRQRKLPSYIPARTFALALWNIAGGSIGSGDTTNLDEIKTVIRQKIPHAELRQALITLIDEADGDFNKARKNIEEWYNAAMDRVSGWYKRRVQIILLILGFAMAIVLNADSINIGKALFQDDALRRSIVAQAEKLPPLPTPTPQSSPAETDEAKEKAVADAKQRVKEIRAQLNQTGLPLGWVRTQTDPQGNIANLDDPRRRPRFGNGNTEWQLWLIKLAGLLLTGLAISQGAPFWFDVLNKFMVIRSTVKPREKSHEEKSKDATGSDDDDDNGNDNNNKKKKS
jgi:hypothetical protein